MEELDNSDVYTIAVSHGSAVCSRAGRTLFVAAGSTLGEEATPKAKMTSTAKLRRRSSRLGAKGALLALLSAPPTAMAACLSLQGSKACAAFQSSSVSTNDSHLVGLL
jgi:hypothetical protein